MKRIKKCIALLLLGLLLLNGPTAGASSNGSELKTRAVTEETKQSFLESLQFNILIDEPKTSPISAFDVSKDHLIAAIQSTDKRTNVVLYTRWGNYDKGYSFKRLGDVCVEWENENLNLFIAKNNYLITISPTAEILDVREVIMDSDDPFTLYENKRHIRQMREKYRRVGDTLYTLQNSDQQKNATEYSMIVSLSDNGKRTVVYNANSNKSFGVSFYGSNPLPVLLLIVLLPPLLIFFVITIAVQAVRTITKTDDRARPISVRI